MLNDVHQAKRESDVVVVSWHWGISSATGQGYRAGQVIDYQIALGHAAVDAGADLIVGHHPHQLEGIEVYKNRAIFYSLGNFAFDPYYGARHRQTTAVARCVIQDGLIQEANFIPYLINEGAQPFPAPPAEAKEVLEEIERKSEPFGTTFRPRTSDVLVLETPALVRAG